MPRGSPGGGLLDPFSAFLGIRFRGRFWVICLMTRGGLGEPPGSLNLRGSATNFTRQRSPSRGAANRRRLAALHRSPPKAPHWEMLVEPTGHFPGTDVSVERCVRVGVRACGRAM